MSEYVCNFCDGRGCEVCYGLSELPPSSPQLSESKSAPDDQNTYPPQEYEEECMICGGSGCPLCQIDSEPQPKTTPIPQAPSIDKIHANNNVTIPDFKSVIAIQSGNHRPEQISFQTHQDFNLPSIPITHSKDPHNQDKDPFTPHQPPLTIPYQEDDCIWCLGEGCDECGFGLGLTLSPRAGDDDDIFNDDLDQNATQIAITSNISNSPISSNNYPNFSPKPPAFINIPQPTALNQESIIHYMYYIIQQIATELYIGLDEAGIFYRKYNFDKKKLISDWFDPTRGSNWIREQCQVPHLYHSLEKIHAGRETDGDKQKYNPISPESLYHSIAKKYELDSITTTTPTICSGLISQTNSAPITTRVLTQPASPPPTSTDDNSYDLDNTSNPKSYWIDLPDWKYLWSKHTIPQESLYFTDFCHIFPYDLPSDTIVSNNNTTDDEDGGAEYECLACMCDYSHAEMRFFPCGHMICHDCFKSYLTSHLNEYGVGILHVTCPGIDMKDQTGVYDNENTLKCGYSLPYSFIFQQLWEIEIASNQNQTEEDDENMDSIDDKDNSDYDDYRKTEPSAHHSKTLQTDQYTNIPTSTNDTHPLFGNSSLLETRMEENSKKHEKYLKHRKNSENQPLHLKYRSWIISNFVENSHHAFIQCPSTQHCDLIITNPSQFHPTLGEHNFPPNSTPTLNHYGNHNGTLWPNQLNNLFSATASSRNLSNNVSLSHNGPGIGFKPLDTHLIQSQVITDHIFSCPCGALFCPKCAMLGAHFPASCDLASDFLSQTSIDSLSNRLIESTTKKCPKCNILITKDKNCNHVVCSKCTHEFCFLCKGQWLTHASDPYTCKKYQAMQMESNRAQEERLKLQFATKQSQKILFFSAFFQSYVSLKLQVLQFHHHIMRILAKINESSSNPHTQSTESKNLDTSFISCVTTMLTQLGGVQTIQQLLLALTAAQWSYPILHYLPINDRSMLLLKQTQNSLVIFARLFFTFISEKLQKILQISTTMTKLSSNPKETTVLDFDIDVGARTGFDAADSDRLTVVLNRSMTLADGIIKILYPSTKSPLNSIAGLTIPFSSGQPSNGSTKTQTVLSIENIFQDYQSHQNEKTSLFSPSTNDKSSPKREEYSAISVPSSPSNSQNGTSLSPETISQEDLALMPNRATSGATLSTVIIPDSNQLEFAETENPAEKGKSDQNSTTEKDSTKNKQKDKTPSGTESSLTPFLDALSLPLFNGYAATGVTKKDDEPKKTETDSSTKKTDQKPGPTEKTIQSSSEPAADGSKNTPTDDTTPNSLKNWCCPSCNCLHFGQVDDLLFDYETIASSVNIVPTPQLQFTLSNQVSSQFVATDSDPNSNPHKPILTHLDLALIQDLGLIDITNVVDKAQNDKWSEFIAEKEKLQGEFKLQIQQRASLSHAVSTMWHQITGPQTHFHEDDDRERRRKERGLYWKKCRESGDDGNVVVVGRDGTRQIRNELNNKDTAQAGTANTPKASQSNPSSPSQQSPTSSLLPPSLQFLSFTACYRGLYYNFNGKMLCANCKNCFQHNEVDCRICFSFNIEDID